MKIKVILAAEIEKEYEVNDYDLRNDNLIFWNDKHQNIAMFNFNNIIGYEIIK